MKDVQFWQEKFKQLYTKGKKIVGYFSVDSRDIKNDWHYFIPDP